MSTELFPDLPGLSWECKFKDEFGTLIQPAAAPGFETRLLLGPDPIQHLELDYTFLREGAYNTEAHEQQILRGFFRSRKGDFESFLLSLPVITDNPADGTVTGQVLTPDAVNNVAPLIVSQGGYYDEAIYEAAGVNGNPGTPPVIYKDGAALAIETDYTWQGPGYAVAGVTWPGLAIQFITGTTGAVITADFSWFLRVRFAQNAQQFDKFLALLWSAQQVQLVTTRTP